MPGHRIGIPLKSHEGGFLLEAGKVFWWYHAIVLLHIPVVRTKLREPVWCHLSGFAIAIIIAAYKKAVITRSNWRCAPCKRKPIINCPLQALDCPIPSTRSLYRKNKWQPSLLTCVFTCVWPCVLDMFWVSECAKEQAFLEDLKQYETTYFSHGFPTCHGITVS